MRDQKAVSKRPVARPLGRAGRLWTARAWVTVCRSLVGKSDA